MDKKVKNILEANILAYLEGTLNEKELSPQENWKLKYQFSDMRVGAFCWVNYQYSTKLLLLGDEYGALAGFFCEKCANVYIVVTSEVAADILKKRYPKLKNLHIIVGLDNSQIKIHKYDYIIANGILESIGGSDDVYKKGYLQKLFASLCESGKLFFTVDNKFGTKYLSGIIDKYSDIPFAGFNEGYVGKRGKLFTKAEIVQLLEQAQIKHYKFYYPLPDYDMSEIIYTDDFLPQKNVLERLTPYYSDKTTMIVDETNLYNDIIDNGIFPILANSFLVECTHDEVFLDKMRYATFSLDRGRKRALATVINPDKVYKRAIYNIGKDYIWSLGKNLQYLKDRNIPVIEYDFINDALVMPYINWPTLSLYLQNIAYDKDKFMKIIDTLWKYVQVSSKHVSDVDNCMLEYGGNYDWGPILAKGYLELVQLNCFYQNGRFLFFDQEYVMDNCPAKFILYRIIALLYFKTTISKYISLDELKEKYGLTDLWTIFQIEERKFLASIRYVGANKEFLQYTHSDIRQIKRNVSILGLNDADSINYAASEKLAELKKVQLRMLAHFQKICQKYSLRYYVIYGTLLGAVRGNGFIPWDDDIDVAMPRKDYERLRALYDNTRNQYFLQTMFNERETFFNGYMRLRDSLTTGIELDDIGQKCHNGLWMDIFPLDVCPEEETAIQKKIAKISYYQSLLAIKVYKRKPLKLATMSNWEYKKYRFLARFYSYAKLVQLLDGALQDSNPASSEKIAIFTHYKTAKIFYKSDFSKWEIVPFENLSVPIPHGYRRCLVQSFGKNYMQLPPLIERIPHHRGIFLPQIPFTEYNARFCDLFTSAEGKILAVFGTGNMFDKYCREYGKRYLPQFLLDNNRAKWGKTCRGIEIKSPAILQERKNIHIIICSVYYKEIAKQLEQLGIYDYKIYANNREYML